MPDLNWLNSTATTNTLTLGLLIATGVYCFLTYRIARENNIMAEQMRAQHAAATSPVIAVNLQIRDQVLINLPDYPASSTYYSMAGLDPAIQTSKLGASPLDGRVKHGHDVQFVVCVRSWVVRKA